MPPEKPRQLANIISGSCSRLNIFMASAVLYDESGNQTWPACWVTCQHTKSFFATDTKTVYV